MAVIVEMKNGEKYKFKATGVSHSDGAVYVKGGNIVAVFPLSSVYAAYNDQSFEGKADSESEDYVVLKG